MSEAAGGTGGWGGQRAGAPREVSRGGSRGKRGDLPSSQKWEVLEPSGRGEAMWASEEGGGNVSASDEPTQEREAIGRASKAGEAEGPIMQDPTGESRVGSEAMLPKKGRGEGVSASDEPKQE